MIAYLAGIAFGVVFTIFYSHHFSSQANVAVKIYSYDLERWFLGLIHF